MNTDDLLRELARKSLPVRRLRGALRRTLAFCAGALVVVLLLLALHGLRADWRQKLDDPAFLGEQAVLLGVFGLAAYASFHLTVPGKPRAALAKALPVGALVVWLGLVLTRCTDGHELGAAGLKCMTRMAGLALLPIAGLALALRRAPPLEMVQGVTLASWSTCSLAMFGTQWLCVRDGGLHVLVWHCGPVLLAGACGALWVNLTSTSARA